MSAQNLIFFGLNFVTISLDSSHVKNQFLDPSRVVGSPLGPLFLFFLLCVSPRFFVFFLAFYIFHFFFFFVRFFFFFDFFLMFFFFFFIFLKKKFLLFFFLVFLPNIFFIAGVSIRV